GPDGGEAAQSDRATPGVLRNLHRRLDLLGDPARVLRVPRAGELPRRYVEADEAQVDLLAGQRADVDAVEDHWIHDGRGPIEVLLEPGREERSIRRIHHGHVLVEQERTDKPAPPLGARLLLGIRTRRDPAVRRRARGEPDGV